MMQVNPLIAVFIIEGLVGLALLGIAFIVLLIRRTRKERTAVDLFIRRRMQTQPARHQELSDLLTQACDLEEEKLRNILAEIDQREKALYRSIVQLFLNRDVGVLPDIEQRARALSEPFCNLLLASNEHRTANQELTAAVARADQEIDRLKAESQRLSGQLSLAMQTMDEVSKEYSKMFGASKPSEELEQSRKKMLEAFQKAEQKVKAEFLG